MKGLLNAEDERPTLVVHIGGAKAGSTAIQNFLFGNRRKLAKNGIAVPDTNLTMGAGRADQIWFFEILIDQTDVCKVLSERLDAVLSDFAASHGKAPCAVVLSAENLSNDHDLASHFVSLKDRFRIAVLLYIRRQEDAYHSAWQQWFAKSGQDVDHWLRNTKADFCDWSAALERWEAIGPDAVAVRIHDRSLLVGQDIVDDFCAVLGLDIREFTKSAKDTNVSFGTHISDLYYGMSAVFENIHDLRVQNRLYNLDIEAAAKRKGEWLFTRDQLELIRKRHAEGNARVKARYLPEMPDENLFPPVPDADQAGVPQEELNRRNIGVLGEFLFKQQFADEVEAETFRKTLEDHTRQLGELLDARETQEKETVEKLGGLEGRVEERFTDLETLMSDIHDLKTRLAAIEHKSGGSRVGPTKNITGSANMDEFELLRRAASALEADANRIVNDKWWKRTRHFRRWSNSLRKRRGRPKKRWPTHFDLNDYLSSQREAFQLGAVAAPVRSTLSPLSVACPSVETETAPRCAVVAMARNESRRAHEIMRHFCALFDRIVLIDHLSEDETGAIAAGYDGTAGAKVHVVRSNEQGYFQSEYMTAAARALIESQSVDWVFFLDFDEALPFKSRELFHQALVQFARADVISGHWVNCALEVPDASEIAGAVAATSETVSPYVKVALNARRLAGREVKVDQGNHSACLDGSTTPTTGERAFGILHTPVCSFERLERKIKSGVESYDESGDTNEQHGFHWRELLKRIDTIRQDPQALTRVALRYGEPLEDVLGDAPVETRTLRLDFARAPESPPAGASAPPEVTRETLQGVLSGILPKRAPAPSDAPFPAIYETVPPREAKLPPEGRAARIQRAILAGAQELEVIVPTAWAGHEPFLFSLMEAIRPRRYVELGTHEGQSFFTACQHLKSNGNYGEAVAIDLWEGDYQAGHYDETVFNSFRFLLERKYPGCGRYIRSLFSDAVAAFEPGSIDLLHIDGLHTYAAVREDYETWRSRLAEAGTMIFHDTSEFQTDFGVWQLFDEVRSDATASFSFQHAHGLGVLAFGSAEVNPAVEFVEHLATDPAMFERHYSTLGRAMVQSARFGISK